MIKYNAYQVAPAELEGVVRFSPASAEELLKFVADRVAPYKKVRIVEFIDEIPKSPSGKILRRVLIERDRAVVAGA